MAKIRHVWDNRRELTEFRKMLRKVGCKGRIYEVKVENFLVKFKSGPNAGRMFIIEGVINEAEAINEAFKRADANKEKVCEDPGCNCCFTQVEVQELPLGQKR